MDYEDARRGLATDTEVPKDETANVVPEISAAAATSARGEIPLIANADNAVILPPGTSLDDLEIRGRDLVIKAPDGRVYVIHDGAVFVPMIVADGVAIPPLNLAAYLNSSEPQPAAGTPQSSGGNFADPNAPLQPAYGLGDLLPYTELSFPQPEDQELLQGVVNHEPAITFVPLTGDGTEVREAHLPPTTSTRANESQGSQFDGNAETTSSIITFVSLDGVDTVLINGVAIVPGSFPQVVASDETGTLVVTDYVFDEATKTGTIHYTYTLNDNVDAPDGSQASFPIVVIDPQGDQASDDLVIRIIDDAPEAFDNTDSVSEGGTAIGNVVTDQQPDIFGADGPAATTPAGGVIGVRAADGDTETEVVGGTGGSIRGLYGTLTLNADGSYTYKADANVIDSNVVDVFVYTIQDGDDDRSTATLTIDVAAVNGSASDNDALVDESGLDGIGSQIVPNGEFFTGGQISVTGASGPFTFELTSPANGAHGALALNAATGAYSYTLQTPFDEPDSNNGRDTINGGDSFTYRVTDQNGNVVGTGTIEVDIVDDVPTAYPNFDTVGEGGTASGNVLTDLVDDVFGADGRAATTPAGGVIGVRAAHGDTTTEIVGGTGTVIDGEFGKLTLNADGTYTYTAFAASIDSDAEDVFVYTIQDGDGDRSTTTLTITVDNVDFVADLERVTVHEAALDLVKGGADLAPGTVTGSNPSSTLETVSGALTVTGATSFALTGPATGAYGLIQLNADGTYVYTLTRPVDNLPHANDGHETEPARDVFTYVASDGQGNAVQGTITIDIVDDTPIARPDSNSVSEGGVVEGKVLPNDTWGADGPDGGVIGVRAAAGNVISPVTTGVGGPIRGLYGTLVLDADADGGYRYEAGAVDGDVADVFVYTIRDKDGDLSTTTLTIRIANDDEPPPPVHVPPSGNDAVALTVQEAALDKFATGNDLAPGSVDGRTPDATTETDVAPNQLTFTAGTDAFASIGFAAVAQQTISVAGLEPGFTMSWTLSGGVLIGTLVDNGNPVGEAIRLQVSDNTGPFVSGGTSNVTVTATLTGRLEHINPDSAQGNVVISGIRVVTAEADGQSAVGTATVTVVDDTPLIDIVDNDATNDDVVTVVEGNSTSGNWTLNPGADGVTTVNVTVGGDTQQLDLSDSNDTAVFNLAAGNLTVGSDGSWSFLANTNLEQPISVSFTLSAVDGDNDLTSDTLRIDIDNGDSPSVAGKAELVLHESGLDTGAPGSGDDDTLDIAPGSVEGTLPNDTTETQVDSNAITYTAGSDNITSIGFAAGASQAPTVLGLEPGYYLTWTNSGTSLLIGTLFGPGDVDLGEAIRVELSGAALSGITAGGSGSVTVRATLTGPLEHDHDAVLQGPVTIQGLEIVSAEADLEAKSGFIDITVHDDNPVMSLEDVSVPDLVTDDDNVDVPGSDTKDFSGLFGWVAGADGYDGGSAATGVVFSLSVTGYDADTETYPDSGLDDSLTGNDVLLRINASGEIEGFVQTGVGTTAVVFTISVDNTNGPTWGHVTLEQERPIEHDNPNDPDEAFGAGAEQISNIVGGLIKLTATITDGDMDTASQSVDITGAFNFQDDGPTVTPKDATPPQLVLDETAAGEPDPDGPGNAAPGDNTATSSISFGTLFEAIDFGKDGAGSVAYLLELSSNGIGSGLFALGTDGAKGAEIQLSNVGGVIIGHVGDANVPANQWFFISVNNTEGNPDFGKVTFSQAKNVWHDPALGDADQPATLTITAEDAYLHFVQQVTDADNDKAADFIDLSANVFVIEDDGPVAVDDTDRIKAGSEGPATGNVITGNDIAANFDANDEDGSPDNGGTDTGARVTAIDNGVDPVEAVSAGGSVTISGLYGDLTIWSNGDYSYARNDGEGGGKVDVFTYTLRDGDGDTDTARLTISIYDGTPTVDIPPAGGATTTVYEEGLPERTGEPAGTAEAADGNGTDNDVTNEQVSGSIGFESEDGVQSISLGGITINLTLPFTSQTIVDNATGKLEVTSYSYSSVTHLGTIGYTYTLKDNTLLSPGPDQVSFALDVVDLDGDHSAPGNLVIRIVNDVPIATDDTYTQTTEGAQVGGNVTDNDNIGADGEGGLPGPVELVVGSLSGGTGTLVLNPDGTFTYDATPGEDADVTFQYTYTDGDGDSDPATVTIHLQPDAGITANNANAYVDDDGLSVAGGAPFDGNPNGDAGGANGDNNQNNVSEGAPASGDEHIWAGTLSATAADGVSKYSLASAAGPGVVGTENVTLTYSVNAGVGTLLATVSGAQARSGTQLFKVELTEATGAYTVTLLNPIMHSHAANTENNASIALTFTASDGDPTPDTDTATLTIDFDDDMVSVFDPADTSFSNTGTFSNVPTGVDLDLGGHIGADGLGSIVFFDDYGPDNLLRDTGGALVTSGGSNITLSGFGTGVLTGSVAAGTVFTITLNSAGDVYTVDFDRALDDGSGRFLSDTSGVRSGSVNFNVLDVPGTTEDLLLAGFNREAGGSTTLKSVNTSTTGVGVGNQSMDDGDTLIVDFVNSPTLSGAGPNLVYDYAAAPGHYTVNNFSFAITQKNAGGTDSIEIWVRAYNGNNVDPGGTADNHLAGLRDDPQLAITEIRVNDVVVPLGGMTSDGSGGYLVSGLDLHDRITVTTSGGYNRIEIENAIAPTGGNANLDGESFDIGQFGFVSVNQGNPINMGFDLTLTDKDGDAITVDNAIVLHSTPAGVPVVLDLDGDGIQYLPVAAGVTFDYGFGAVGTAWVGATDGLLAHQTAGGFDIVFADDAPGAKTDLEGLALAHDSNGDGVFDAQDTSFAAFGVWQDANSDGVVDAGEFRSLAQAGISAINLTSDGKAYSAAGGDVHVHGEGTFVRADGSTGALADVSFATNAERALARSAELATVAAAAGAISALTVPALLASDSGESVPFAQDASFSAAAPSAPTPGDDGEEPDQSSYLMAALERSFAARSTESSVGGDDDGSAQQDAGIPAADDDHSASAGAQLAGSGIENAAVGPDASLFAGDLSGFEDMQALFALSADSPVAAAQDKPGDIGALQEAVADAAHAELADQLVAQLASQHDASGAAPSITGIAHLLTLSIEGEGAGGQPAYDFNHQMADEALALAATG